MQGVERRIAGSDHGESGVNSLQPSGDPLWLLTVFRIGEFNRRFGRAKKCGAEIGDPNLRFQPRLPGSVVGEASMGQVGKGDKITGVTVLW